MSNNSQKTILIVEDDDSFRDIMVRALESKKFKTLQAVNGKEGVEKALSDHPDLIIFDLLMPVMGGMDAFKKVREDAWGKNAAVIILTNQNATSEMLIQDIVTYKPFHYLVKSNERIYDVVKKIEDILANESNKQ